MRDWLHAHRPATSRRGILLLVALTWTIVGTALLFFGTRWVLPNHAATALLPFAIFVGAAKSRFLLHPAARQIVYRIQDRGDGQGIWGFVPPKTWALVGAMAVFGRLLRASPISIAAIGLLYAAVGTGLIMSTWRLWRAWYLERQRE